MTRETTDQLYIELDYFTPEEYYVYIGEAQSQATSSFSVSATVGVIKQAQSQLTVNSSVSATISHIEGADLFAFTEAQLAIQISLIKNTEITAASTFSIAIDFVRQRDTGSEQDAVISAIIAGLRSRTVTLETQAAFSLAAEATRIKGTSATLTSTFTQTTTPLRIKQNTTAGNGRTASQKTVTRTGNTVLSSAQSQFGGHSALFDGNGDRLDIASTADFGFGTGNITIEFWARPISLGSANTVVDFRTSGSSTRLGFSYVSSRMSVRIGSTEILSHGSNSPTNTWQHIAYTRQSNTHRLFINGQLTDTATNTSDFGSAEQLRIGERYDGTFDYHGYIDDLRIIKGTALYTANFTAPTSQLTDVSGTVLLLNMNVVTDTTNFVDTFTQPQITGLTYASSAQVSPIINQIKGYSANVSATSNISANQIRIRDGASDNEVAFSLAADNTKLIQYSSDLLSQSTVSAIISHIEGADIVANGFASLSAELSNVTKETAVALETTASQSTVTGFLKSLDSNLQSTASILVLPRILVRNTQLTVNSGGIYNSHFINTSSKQFGAGSLSWNIGDRIFPTSNIVWTGSVFKTFTTGYTWTSSDGLTWTRTTNNLSYSIGIKISFVNARYCFLLGSSLQYSTDGDSWSTATITNLTSGSAYSEVFYVNGQWRVFRSSLNNEIRVFSSTNLTSWTNANLVNSVSTIRDITFNNSFVTISYYFEQFPNYTNSQLRWNGTTIQTNFWTIVTSTSLQIQNGAWDGSNTQISALGDTVGTSRIYVRAFTTVTNYDIAGNVVDVNFVNGRWFISTDIGIYSGTDPNSLTLVDSVATERVIFGSSRYLSYSENTNSLGFIRHSTNATTWASDQVENISGVPGSIVYSRDNNSDLGNFSTIDFWVNLTGGAAGVADITRVIEIAESASRYLRISVFSDSNPNNNFVIVSKSYNSVGDSLDARPLPYGWNHIRIVQNGSNARIFANGVSEDTSNSWPTGQIIAPVVINNSIYPFDELLISDSQLSSVSDTTCVVPTQPWENNTNTDLLLHFDTDLNDDSRFNPIISAALATVAQVSAFTRVDYNVSIDLVSNSNLSCSVQKSTEIILSAFSDANLSVSIDKIKNANADLVSESAVSVTANSLIIGEADLNVEFNQTTDSDRIRDTVISTESIATQLSAVVKIATFFINADVVAQMAINAVKTTDVDSSQSAIINISIDAIRSVDYSADISGVALTVVSADRTRSTLVTLASTASVNALANADRSAEAVLTSEFVADITTQGLIDIIALVMSSGTLALTPNIIKSTAVDLGSEFTQTTETFDSLSQRASADLVSEFTQTTNNARTRSVAISTDSVASQLTAIAKIGQGLITLESACLLSCEAVYTSSTTISLASVAGVITDISIIKQGQLDIQSQADIEVEGTTNIVGEGHLDSEFALSAQGQITQTISAALSVSTALICDTDRVRPFASLEVSAATMAVTGQLIRDVVIVTEAIATEMVITDLIIGIEADLISRFTVTINTSVVHLNEYVYVIPGESRERKIAGESREVTIRR